MLSQQFDVVHFLHFLLLKNNTHVKVESAVTVKDKIKLISQSEKEQFCGCSTKQNENSYPFNNLNGVTERYTEHVLIKKTE